MSVKKYTVNLKGGILRDFFFNRKLRSSDHGQLLLNLCFALIGLYLSFIVALHSKTAGGFCAFSGAALQYFFLVSFAVMAAEAVNLYFNLVIVLGRKIHSFPLKVTVVSWGKSFMHFRTLAEFVHWKELGTLSFCCSFYVLPNLMS